MVPKHHKQRVRYAVVGLGQIAQTAVLPAFERARANSELVALVSGDKEKMKNLGEKYEIDKLYLYSEFEDCLKRQEVDAVYISTPNSYHRNIMETAARYGVHVLCEKPLAVTTEDCLSMISEAEKNNIFLMVAYRLNFEPANLRAIHEAHARRIGEVKLFQSSFTYQVKEPHNIRLEDAHVGGGAIYDIGVYCINTARNLFKAEPIQVFAMAGSGKDSRFKKTDESVSCILKFPEGKIASFTVSFGAFPTSDFDLIGTKGRIRLERAYGYEKSKTLKIYEEGKILCRKYSKQDQFAPELSHFSDCIQRKKKPAPSGEEGLLDIKIVEALLLSIDLGSPIMLEEIHKRAMPRDVRKVSKPSFLKPGFFQVFSSSTKHH